jgi:ATP phosphoribosyltransferase
MLQATMAAEGKVGLMMNVPTDKLKEVIAILPALKNPTISSLSDDQWFSVSTIIEESTVRKLVPKLKLAGACGIVEYPISKIIE